LVYGNEIEDDWSVPNSNREFRKTASMRGTAVSGMVSSYELMNQEDAPAVSFTWFWFYLWGKTFCFLLCIIIVVTWVAQQNPESLRSSYLIWCSSNCMFCNDFILTARRNHLQVQSCEFLNALCIWNNV